MTMPPGVVMYGVFVEDNQWEGDLAFHTKLYGEIDIEAILRLEGEELDAALYKGGIRRFVMPARG